MHASAVVALALVAAAAPALSAPVYTRDESGAFKIDTGLIKDGVDIADGVIDGANGIKNLFSGNNNQQRGLVEREAIGFFGGGPGPVVLPDNFQPRIGTVVQQNKREEELLARAFPAGPTGSYGVRIPPASRPYNRVQIAQRPSSVQFSQGLGAQRGQALPSAGQYASAMHASPLGSSTQHTPSVQQGLQQRPASSVQQGLQQGSASSVQQNPQQGPAVSHGPMSAVSQPTQGAQTPASAQRMRPVPQAQSMQQDKRFLGFHWPHLSGAFGRRELQDKRFLGFHWPHISGAMGRSLNELD